MKAPSCLALLCACLRIASATKPGLGWRVSIDTSNVEFSTDNIGNDQAGLFVSAPLTIERTSSAATNIVVTGTLRSVGNNTEDGAESRPQTAFVETIAVNDNTTNHNAFFDLVIPSPWVNQVVDLSVTVPGTRQIADTNGLIITHDPATDTFTGKQPGAWAHEENVRIVRELEDEAAGSREIPQDPSDLGEEPDCPAVDDGVRVDGEPKDGTQTGGGRTTTIVVRQTTTICPTPTPKPTCKRSSDTYRLHSRQVARSPAIVDAKLTFTGWNNLRQVLRLTRITAWANVYTEGGAFIERIYAVKVTDVLGNARFRFDISTGQRIIVDRLVARLEGDKFVVGTRLLETDPLVRSTPTLRLTINPWYASAGETKSYENNFPRNVKLDGIIVADAMQRLDDYVRINIVPASETGKIDVWFPSTDPGTYFTSAGVFLNIPDNDARDPDVIAHEYGHWLHFQARGRARFDGGLDHDTCDSPKLTTALSEGFATAFNLIALDQTPLGNSVYGRYTDRNAAGLEGHRLYEVYGCAKKTLENDEGRITAAIFDLGDRLLDEQPVPSDEYANVYDDFSRDDINIRFTPNLLFWRALRGNPQNMRQYWGAARARMPPEAEVKAWNVLRYNWAEFDQDQPAP